MRGGLARRARASSCAEEKGHGFLCSSCGSFCGGGVQGRRKPHKASRGAGCGDWNSLRSSPTDPRTRSMAAPPPAPTRVPLSSCLDWKFKLIWFFISNCRFVLPISNLCFDLALFVFDLACSSSMWLCLCPFSPSALPQARAGAAPLLLRWRAAARGGRPPGDWGDLVRCGSLLAWASARCGIRRYGVAASSGSAGGAVARRPGGVGGGWGRRVGLRRNLRVYLQHHRSQSRKGIADYILTNTGTFL